MRFTEKLNIGQKFEGKPYCLSGVMFFYPRTASNALCFQTRRNGGKWLMMRFHHLDTMLDLAPKRRTSRV